MLLNFVVHNFPALVIESSFGYLLSPFNNPSVKLWILFFLSIPYFLLLQVTSGSS